MNKRQKKTSAHKTQLDKVVINRKSIYLMMKSFAETNSIELNPHKPTLFREIDGLLDNYKAYGYPYCPCRLGDIRGDLFIDKRISCPCVYHKKEINENGFCKCELFISPLRDKPRLISTSIHRLKIGQWLNKDTLEIKFEREGENTGEVKVYIPEEYQLGEIKIETKEPYQIKGKVFDNRILFFNLCFSDVAKILIGIA